MKILVTTCERYRYLIPDFLELFSKFWANPPQLVIDVAQKGESWTAQMIRVLSDMKDDHVLRLCEDFYMYRPVDAEALAHATALAGDYFRIGLQGRFEGYLDCSSLAPDGLYTLAPEAEYLCSLEASIFDRKQLLEALKAAGDMNIWEFEMFGSEYARKEGWKVAVTPDRVISYKDATRRGEQRIKKVDGQFLLLAPGDVWVPLFE